MRHRVLSIQHPEIVHDEDRGAQRPIASGAILHGLAGQLARMLRVLGAFFAAGGSLS